MADASIDWTDDEGAATLQNVLAGTGWCRFASWEPAPVVVGQVRTLLGTGARRVWAYRTDRGATFALEDIAHTDMALMDRLSEHLATGGTVSVTTGDADARVYPTCGLAPGAAAPKAKLTDRAALYYRMEFALVDLRATPERMICRY